MFTFLMLQTVGIIWWFEVWFCTNSGRGSLVSKKVFETRQNEKRCEGLTWCHMMKDQKFNSPHQNPSDAIQQQLINNNSRCRQISRFFPLFVFRGSPPADDLKQTKQLSRICHPMGFLIARTWRLKSVREISLR